MFFLENLAQIGKNKYRVIFTKCAKNWLDSSKITFRPKSALQLFCRKPFNWSDKAQYKAHMLQYVKCLQNVHDMTYCKLIMHEKNDSSRALLSYIKPATHLAILYADHRDRRIKSPISGMSDIGD